MASNAAILAIGKPVAFDASALDRDTRGFISMTTMRPSAGFTANWMLQPPASTPTARMMGMARSRTVWDSRAGGGGGVAGARPTWDRGEGPVRGVRRELDVAAAGVDAHGADDGDGQVAHRLVLAV